MVTDDENMSNVIQVTPFSHCYGCLARTDEDNLTIYNLQAVSLQTIFQAKQLSLCYVCTKLAKNTEKFIHRVKIAQDLLKEITDLSDNNNQIKIENSRSTMKPLNLMMFLLDPNDVIEVKALEYNIKIEYDPGLSGSDLNPYIIKQEQNDNFVEINLPSDDTEDIPEVQYDVNWVKDEKKHENISNKTNMSNKTNISNKTNMSNKTNISKQLNISKKTNVSKQTHMSKKTNMSQKTNIGKKVKSEKIAKEKPPGEIDTTKIETIYLTAQQCLEEREKMRLDESYNSCEFKCTDCIKGFTYKPSFDKHMEKHSKLSGDFECEICKQRVASKDKLTVHKNYHEVRYRCKECGLTRVCRTSIADHIAKSHGTGLVYGCPKCEKTFKCKAALRKHTYHSHKEKTEQCPYCNQQYATKDSLKAHLRRQHPVEVSSPMPVKKYACTECGKAFETPSLLKIHGAKHSLQRDYYCVECNKSFKTHASLQQHLKTVSVHIKSDDMKHPCPQCNKLFFTKSHVDRHLNDIHIKAARFCCDQCGKEFSSKYKLTEHSRQHYAHETPRSFLCHVCNKGFRSKPVLEVHLRIHTGEKPFQCPACPAQFKQNGSLYNHKKLVHKIVGKTKKETASLQSSPSSVPVNPILALSRSIVQNILSE